jgi:hypothetical protein
MSTITREFTKEQLIEHIKGRKEFADECAADSTLHPERREYYELTAEALRIALASLEAEPVAYIIQDADARSRGEKGILRYFANISDEDINEYEITVTPLFTAPPAPVSVPDFGALTKCIVQRLVDYGAADDDAIARAEEFVYNACRDAMLNQEKGNG